MRKVISISSRDGRLTLRFIGTDTSNNEYDILDEQEHYLTTISEETLKDLPAMIEELLQMKNKRDW